MSVSRSPAPSSIDLSGVPARVAEAVAQVVAVCHEQFRSDPCPEAFEEAELRVRETMNALACELLGAVMEAGRRRVVERDGQSWFRVAATPRTIMTSLGPLTTRVRSGASGSSRFLSRRRLPDAAGGSARSADDGSLHGAGSGGVLCEDRRHESVSTLQRLTRTMHERWETLGPETLDSIRSTDEAVNGVAACRGLLARGRLRHGTTPGASV